MQLARFDIYLNLKTLGLVQAGEAVLQENDGVLTRFGFRYTPDYLLLDGAIALDPVNIPLKAKAVELGCDRGIPGILDDYLPDDWGRKILSYISFYKERKNLNRHSCIDMLSVLGNSRIGAIQWVPQGGLPQYCLGADLGVMKDAERIAQEVDSEQLKLPQGEMDNVSLLYLANAGTGAGGARPKALIHDGKTAYLAKFNRLHQDSYNNARVELACLLMAKQAGLEIYPGHVESGINARDVLFLERFDIEPGTSFRRHLVTINALMKDQKTQRDGGGVFRYDDIAELIRRYSANVERDLIQLLSMMLFNGGINNTDTHERNFSFINDGSGYQLAPAYDMVPTISSGAYPVAGFAYKQYPPKCSEVEGLGKIFGLPKTIVRRVSEQVAAALNMWPHFAELALMDEKDTQLVSRVIQI